MEREFAGGMALCASCPYMYVKKVITYWDDLQDERIC